MTCFKLREKKEETHQTRKPYLAERNLFSRIISAFKEALFPTKCLVCGSFFHPAQGKRVRLQEKKFSVKVSMNCSNGGAYKERSAASSLKEKFRFDRLFTPFLCSACLAGFAPVESPICISCGIMFKSREGDDHFCGDCIKLPKKFKTARAPGIYDQALMRAIHCFKYKGKIQLARPFGALLFASFLNLWDIRDIDMVIPVPLHMKRLRDRGFNQAYLLVKNWKALAMDLNIEWHDITIDRCALVRNKWTEPQTGLGRKKRIKNIKNAFKVDDPSKIDTKRILVVDDVYTTGATANECAKALLKSGAKSVDVLTLARAM